MMERLPNLFESYTQPENKLTLALLQTLAIDHGLVRAFIRWAIPGLPPPSGIVSVYSQRKPAVGRGIRVSDPELDPTTPDGWLAAEDLLVALEVKKDPGALHEVQLRGHLRALARREAAQRALLVLTPDPRKPAEVVALEDAAEATGIHVCWRGWRELHAWACAETAEAEARSGRRLGAGIFLLRCFREYMEMSEVSGFAGVVFDEGYDYRRAKAILRGLRQDLAADVSRLYPNPPLSHGRDRITDDGTLVWDVFARGEDFTADPHFTLSIHDNGATLSLTVPDKAGHAWSTLVRLASERVTLNRSLRQFLGSVLRVQAQRRPTVQFNLMQRHWEIRGRPPEMDARLIARLDTAPICPSSLRAKGVREREGWYQAVLALLATGKGSANWEFQIQTHFHIDRKITKTPELKEEMVRILETFKPLYQLVSLRS